MNLAEGFRTRIAAHMPSEFDSRYVAPGWREEPHRTADSSTEELRRGSSEGFECESTVQAMARMGVADVAAAGMTPVPPGPVPARLTAGAELVPGYRLVGRIGEGGSSEVWKAIGPGGLPVAMKFVRVAEEFGSSPADRQRLRSNLRALELMREVRHANLLPLFGAWHREGLLIFVMELADCTLIDRCNEAIRAGEPGIPLAELIESMRQAACGIDYLNAPRHALVGRRGMGILHRDIKPQNLLLVGGCVKVGDFGQAKLLEDTARNTGSLTAYYAPPELFDGLMSPWTDQYSLAVTYCQLRCGHLPFTGNPLQVMMGHFRGVPDLSQLPRAERPAVARALAKRPHERWPDCRSFVEAITGPGVRPKRRHPDIGRPSDPRPGARRGPGRLARASSLSASTVASLALAALLAGGRSSPEASAIRTVAPPPRPPAIDVPSPPQPSVVVAPGKVTWTESRPPAPDPSVRLARGDQVEGLEPAPPLVPLPSDVWAPAAPVGVVKTAEAAIPPARAVAVGPLREVVDRRPRTATIEVLMPNEKAELVVRGEVGKGNPDEWYGPKRVVHTPPLREGADYLIGAFFLGDDGLPLTRSRRIRIEPGRVYEVDLRSARPTSRQISRPDPSDKPELRSPS